MGMPAVQLALLFRCNAQGPGGDRSATLSDWEKMGERLELLRKLNGPERSGENG